MKWLLLLFRIIIFCTLLLLLASSSSSNNPAAFIVSTPQQQQQQQSRGGEASLHWSRRRRRRSRISKARISLLFLQSSSWTEPESPENTISSSDDDDDDVDVDAADAVVGDHHHHAGFATTATTTAAGIIRQQRQQSCTLLGGNEIRSIRVQQRSKEENNNVHADADDVLAPAFAVFGAGAATAAAGGEPSRRNIDGGSLLTTTTVQQPQQRKGLEALVPGAFCIQDAISAQDCDEMIQTFESLLLEVQQASSRVEASSSSSSQSTTTNNNNNNNNNKNVIQIVVTPQAAQSISQRICPWMDMETVNSMAASLPRTSEMDAEFDAVGMNQRWRIYKYTNDDSDNDDDCSTHAAHPDILVGGVPPCSISRDGSTLIWDATGNDDNDNALALRYPSNTVSRYTAIIYLNDNFQGGYSEFYINDDDDSGTKRMIAAIKPRQGSILLIPQVVGGHDAVAFARQHWPLYKESSVQKCSSSSNNNSRGGDDDDGGGSLSKYIIQSEILFTRARNGLCDAEKEDPLWKNDELVRSAFLPKSRVFSQYFASQIQTLYNPQMGVENAGAFLYAFVRFTKVRRVVEIGAGYTTPWLLQALQDNDNELSRIGKLQNENKCRLLDYPWTVEHIVNDYNINDNVNTNDKEQSLSSSLLCIDNCLHQRETATGAGAIAKMLGLSHLLQFITGDAYDMKFEPQSIDLLWCDFGVGSRMKEFAAGSWNAVKPGGFLICHSTLTNASTREWLEAIRSRRGEQETGIPAGEFVELSLLEPHKHYQNSITILQRRRHPGGVFEEPLYSEYA